MKVIERIEDFQSLVENSSQPFFVFKHSTSCPISAQAHRNVEKYLMAHPETKIYSVLVIESRPLSNHIAEFFSITHQSPQIILIHNQKPVWNASHLAINETAMDSQMSHLMN